MYFTGLSTHTNKDLLIREIGIAFGDYVITCPTIQFAKNVISSDKTGTKVYQYYYNSKIGKPKYPGVIDGAQWPQYYSMGANIIAPYYEYTNEPKSVTNFNIGLKIDECDYLWNQYNH
ncbi:unnamed protein product, partial [Medioppia subpectinata]